MEDYAVMSPRQEVVHEVGQVGTGRLQEARDPKNNQYEQM
jgi:hypothetical protein